LTASKAVFWNIFKKVTIFACILILGLGFRLFIARPVADQAYPLKGNYRSYADNSMVALQSMFNSAAGHWMDTTWWQQAEALETTIDYSARTSNITYTNDIAIAFNDNRYAGFLNKYYDDEGWWAITWIKAYDLTGTSDYLTMAKSIFSDMARGWDSTCGGGLWWSKARTYKNAIPNELFFTIAARLHQRTPGDIMTGGGGPRNISYIKWASKEWQWFKSSGMINSSNLVNDGLVIDGKTCRNNGQNTWTYNQGVILGGLTDMYRITGDISYLAQAQAIADANIITNVDDKGILYEKGCEPTDSCDVDVVQFKGIFIKNLYYLYQADKKQKYKDFIIKNAAAILRHDQDGSNNFGMHWDGPFDKSQANRQSSAMDTLNAAMLL
jgi:predicted alpha-1,6-mannanase (GH76 family)